MDDKKAERHTFFTKVHDQNLWAGKESRSGQGSDKTAANEMINALHEVLRSLKVASLLDVPCGDFNWMKEVDLGSTTYIGGDIVEDIVTHNNEIYASPLRRFEIIDIVTDALPAADMIFVRDCFIHFTNDLIMTALQNIVRSRIRYVCLTHDLSHHRYPNRHNIELDRARSGVNSEFRPNDFELPPFSFPAPIEVIPDGTAWNQWDGTKAMAVWELATVQAALKL
jgi:hypothetical protein